MPIDDEKAWAAGAERRGLEEQIERNRRRLGAIGFLWFAQLYTDVACYSASELRWAIPANTAFAIILTWRVVYLAKRDRDPPEWEAGLHMLGGAFGIGGAALALPFCLFGAIKPRKSRAPIR